MLIAWRGDIELKITELDAQHEQMVSLFYDLQEAIISNKANEKIEVILEELIAYANHHFSTEKKYFKKYNYPETDRHIKEHKKISKSIIELNNNVRNNELRTSLILIKYLQHWINDHILSEDKKFSDHFHRQNFR
jgi:hemerythrin-like metal-binding protein